MKHIVSSERVDCERKVPVDLACLSVVVGVSSIPYRMFDFVHLVQLWTVKLSIISRTISHHSLESMALAGLHFSVYSCLLPASSWPTTCLSFPYSTASIDHPAFLPCQKISLVRLIPNHPLTLHPYHSFAAWLPAVALRISLYTAWCLRPAARRRRLSASVCLLS
jgi:hypothetical protein